MSEYQCILRSIAWSKSRI